RTGWTRRGPCGAPASWRTGPCRPSSAGFWRFCPVWPPWPPWASAPRTTAATSAPPWPPTARRTALPPWWATRTWTSPVRSRTPPPSWPAWTGWGFGRGASPTSGTTPGTSPSAAMPRRPCGPWAGRRRWSAWPPPGAAPRPWIWRRRTPWPPAPRTCRICW
ncbi:Neu5Ac permease, partial [Dysosmobacter welbionis]